MLGGVDEAFAMRLARVGPRDWIVRPSRLAISLLSDGPSPSCVIAERYCRSAGVARDQREWKNPASSGSGHR